MKKGDVVVMSKEALENYGAEWEGVLLRVDHVSTKYMPSKEFFAKGMPEGYHPGYDPAANGQPLYSLSRADTGEELSFDLYSWELRRTK